MGWPRLNAPGAAYVYQRDDAREVRWRYTTEERLCIRHVLRQLGKRRVDSEARSTVYAQWPAEDTQSAPVQ